jgi:lipid II:glycine glycyltransferase (peptidoglycan interpeptide bridge formation enzyme)
MGLVFKENQPVGCGIILFTKHSVSIPWASTLQEYNKLSPNMMLYWNFLKFAADNDKKTFDFGRSTLNEGTYNFKKQWGAEPQQLFWYSVSKTPQRPASSTTGKSRKCLEQAWQKMPLSLVNFVGPKVRKYISL